MTHVLLDSFLTLEDFLKGKWTCKELGLKVSVRSVDAAQQMLTYMPVMQAFPRQIDTQIGIARICFASL